MQRNRRRRINSEGELMHSLQTEQHSLSSGKVAFMEEVNYRMEEAADKEEANYLIVPNLDREMQVKEAFKKKRKGTLESFEACLEKESTMMC